MQDFALYQLMMQEGRRVCEEMFQIPLYIDDRLIFSGVSGTLRAIDRFYAHFIQGGFLSCYL